MSSSPGDITEAAPGATPPRQPTPGIVQPVALLSWHEAWHFLHEPAVCVLCGHDTVLRSHKREPVCKVCAETWNSQHPGEDRFVSDAPRSRRKATP